MLGLTLELSVTAPETKHLAGYAKRSKNAQSLARQGAKPFAASCTTSSGVFRMASE